MGDTSRLAETSLRLRKAYARWRSFRQIINFPESKEASAWQNLASLCNSKHLMPEEFVEVMFHAYPPWPWQNQVTGQKSLGKFFEFRRAAATSIVNETMGQLICWDRALAAGKDPKEHLFDSFQNYDALFTYLISTQKGWDEGIGPYKAAAFTQYLRSVYYDGAYKELIPEEFKERKKLMGVTYEII